MKSHEFITQIDDFMNPSDPTKKLRKEEIEALGLKNKKDIHMLEDEQKNLKKLENLKNKLLLQAEKDAQKKNKLVERMEKIFKNEGKMLMARSQPKKVAKKNTKKQDNEEEVLRKRYLGDLGESEIANKKD